MSEQSDKIRQRVEAIRRAGSPAISMDIVEAPQPPPPRGLRGDNPASSAIAYPVVIVDVKIRFMSLVTLMVKVAFAAIPAAFCIGFIWGTIFLAARALLPWLVR